MASGLSWSTAAAQAAGLDMTVLEKVSTAFVPSDEAIQAYAAADPQGYPLLSSTAGKSAVEAHIIPNKQLILADLPDGEFVYESVGGVPLTVNKSGGAIKVSAGKWTANVIKPDVSMGNAVLHIVDTPLVPVA